LISLSALCKITLSVGGEQNSPFFYQLTVNHFLISRGIPVSPIKLEDIREIKKNPQGKGYLIIFRDNREIVLYKKRTIAALLTLIRYGEGCESDLTNATNNLQEIKTILKGKIPENLIQDSYADANKPSSELWNEEGFNFIYAPPGQKRLGSQKYVLNSSDHEQLFTTVKPPIRKPPSSQVQKNILEQQLNRCNFRGAILKKKENIHQNTYAKGIIRSHWSALGNLPIEK